MKGRNEEVIDYCAIAQTVKSLRQNNGMSQGQLAKAVYVSTSHISNIESVNANVGLGTIVRIAQFFDVSVDFLLYSRYKASSDETDFYAGVLGSLSIEERNFIINMTLGLMELLNKNKNDNNNNQ